LKPRLTGLKLLLASENVWLRWFTPNRIWLVSVGFRIALCTTE